MSWKWGESIRRGMEALARVLPRIGTGDGLAQLSSRSDDHLPDRLAWPDLLSERPYLTARPIIPLALSLGCPWRRCLFCPDRTLPFFEVPRRAEPRSRVAAGSVGIPDGRTGLYAMASPGGWNIIGRTPRKLFDPHAADPFVLKAGMRVRFRAVSANEFDA